MIKFVSLLIAVMSLNFMVSFTSTNRSQLDEIGVEFSKKAIAIESGQPVFSKDTKISISNSTKSEMKLYINDEEKVFNKKIELTNLEQGTYTVMIIPEKGSLPSKKTLGFTIQ